MSEKNEITLDIELPISLNEEMVTIKFTNGKDVIAMHQMSIENLQKVLLIGSQKLFPIQA